MPIKKTNQSQQHNSQSKNSKQQEPTPVNRILNTANNIIEGDREQTYGSPDKNLAVIAEYWSTHINALLAHTDIKITLDINDVCTMMALLKLARLANNPEHFDSKVDVCGYIALMDKCQLMPNTLDVLGSHE